VQSGSGDFSIETSQSRAESCLVTLHRELDIAGAAALSHALAVLSNVDAGVVVDRSDLS
jgi:hypothetical protein